MRLNAATIPVATLAFMVPVVLGAQDGTDKSQADVDRLQGTWVLVSIHVREVPQRGLPGRCTCTFTDRTFTRKVGDRFDEFSYRLEFDVTAKPKRLTFHRETNSGKDLAHRAIYRFDGDSRLILCFSNQGQPWPIEFEARKDKYQSLSVWDRVDKSTD